jgi:tetratricopeptide (TPR) repeat protein
VGVLVVEKERRTSPNIINESKYSEPLLPRSQPIQPTNKGYVGRKQRRRGLDAVISATREYSKRDRSTYDAAAIATIPGMSLQEAARRSANEAASRAMRAAQTRAPQRPVGQGNGSGGGGGVRVNRNLIQHSNAVFMGHGLSAVAKDKVGEATQSSITGTVLHARARSIRQETPEIDAEEATRREEEEERERLKFEEQKRKDAELEAEQFLAAIASEEEERRLYVVAQEIERVRLEEEARQEKLAEEEAAANYAAAVAAAIAAEEAAAETLREEHRAIQRRYLLLNNAERPKTSPGRVPPVIHDSEEIEMGMRVNEGEIERLETRSRSRAEPGYVVQKTLNRTPITLPFHLDPVAKAVAAELKKREEEEAEMKLKMKEEAAARAKEAAAKRAAAGFFQGMNGGSSGGVETDSDSTGKKKKETDINKNSDDSSSELKASRRRRKRGGENEDSNNDDAGDVKKEIDDANDSPLLRVYRRARPRLPGIRPMVSPQDAANALTFSVAMFHRDPTTMRVRWDGSLPLPPDAETCCRRGMSLLSENEIQGSIFWFSVGYGQEADTYADGTQQLPESDSDRAHDPYFCSQDIPETVIQVNKPRSGFEHGVLSILSRGIAYSRMGCWSQALWDFKEADSMSQGKCREARYFCACAHEARQEIHKAIKIVQDILSTEPTDPTLVIFHREDNDEDDFDDDDNEGDDDDDVDDDDDDDDEDDPMKASSRKREQKKKRKRKRKRKKKAVTYEDVFYSHVSTLKATCLADLGRYKFALTAYDDAVLRDPANTYALWSRTRLLLDPSIIVSSGSEQDHVDDGINGSWNSAEQCLAREIKRKRDALKDLTRLVSLDPGRVEYLEDAVDMFVDLAEYSEGLAVVQVLVEVWEKGGVGRSGVMHTEKNDAFGSDQLPSHGFEREIFLSLFPDRQSSDVGKRQLATAYCLRGRLRSFLLLEPKKARPNSRGSSRSDETTMQAVLDDLKRAEELDSTLPHIYLYRGALRHPARLLKSARLNNEHDERVKKKNEKEKKNSNIDNNDDDDDDDDDKDNDDSSYYPPSFFDDVGGHHVIADLSTAVDLLPSSVDALILRASMYIRVGMFTPALHDLREAAQLQPNSMEIWLLIARIYLQHLHDYDSAICATTFAIRLDPRQNAPYYVRAEAHLRSGEVDIALQDYTKILRNDPSEPWPWLFQGHILAARGRARLAMYSSIAFLRATGEKTSQEIAATAEAKKAEEINKRTKQSFRKLWKEHDHSDDPSVRKKIKQAKATRLDQANDLLEDFNRAAIQYKSAAARNPTVHTFCRLADALVHLGDVTEALNVLHRALEMDEDSPEVHATLGRCYLSIEDYDRALESFDTSIYLNPADPALFNERGVCKTLQEQTHLIHIRDLMLQQARTGGFEPLKEDFVSHDRSSDEGEFDDDEEENFDYFQDEEAKKSTTRGRRKKGRRKRKKRRQASPKGSRMNKRRQGKETTKGTRKAGKKRRGRSKSKRKKRVNARQQLAKRMETNKREPYIPKTKEQLENDVGMSGLSDINKCLHLDESNTDALLNRAELYVRAGQDHFAVEDFERVLSLDPENVRCFINRGVHCVGRSQPANAIQDFDHALRNDPSNPLALYNRAVAYTDARQYDQAIQDYTNCLAVVPEAVAALRNRGLLHLWSGNAAQAKADLCQLLELVQDTPEESESHDLLPALGHCEAQLGMLVPNALDAVNRAMHHRGGVLVDALVSRGSVFYSLASAGYEYAPSSTFGSIAHRLRTHDEIIGSSTIGRLESEPGRASLNARSKSHAQWSELSISDFSKALRLDPSSTTIRANLAEALSASAASLQRNFAKQETVKVWKRRQRQRTKLALKHFSAVLSMNADHANALNGRGVVHLRLGRLEEAYTDLTMSLEKIDQGVREKRTLTEIIAIRKAMNKANAGGSTNSSSAGGSNAGGGHSSQENQIAETLLKQKGLNVAKQRCRCLVDRAMVLVRAGSSKQAEQDLIDAVSLGEEHHFDTPSALHDLGTLKLRAGKVVHAIQLFDRAISIHGRHVSLARMSRGVAFCALAPPALEKAMEDLNVAVYVHPSNVHGLYNRAVCHAMLNNLRAAEEDLMRAIAIAPGDKMLYDQRGKTMAAMGRPKMALKDFATSLLLE